MKKRATEQNTAADHEREKKPVDILDQDKGTTTRNPMHGDLSDTPEKENKAVRNSEASKKKKH